MNRNKFAAIFIVLSLLLCSFIYTDAMAKDVDVLGAINFELNDNAIIQNLTLNGNEVYSVVIRDDAVKFMAALSVKEYTQEQVSQYSVEGFKKLLPKEKSFRSFVSFDKTSLNGIPIDIIVYDSYADGMELRSKWYIFKYQKYFFHFITQAPKGDFFKNNSKILDKIISTIKFTSSVQK